MQNKIDITHNLIVEELNLIFKDIDTKIRTSISKEFKINTRKTKVDFETTLLYTLLYTQKNLTKNEVVNNLNL